MVYPQKIIVTSVFMRLSDLICSTETGILENLKKN